MGGRSGVRRSTHDVRRACEGANVGEFGLGARCGAADGVRSVTMGVGSNDAFASWRGNLCIHTEHIQ